jgi:hypothetical protein
VNIRFEGKVYGFLNTQTFAKILMEPGFPPPSDYISIPGDRIVDIHRGRIKWFFGGNTMKIHEIAWAREVKAISKDKVSFRDDRREVDSIRETTEDDLEGTRSTSEMDEATKTHDEVSKTLLPAETPEATKETDEINAMPLAAETPEEMTVREETAAAPAVTPEMMTTPEDVAYIGMSSVRTASALRHGLRKTALRRLSGTWRLTSAPRSRRFYVSASPRVPDQVNVLIMIMIILGMGLSSSNDANWTDHVQRKCEDKHGRSY